MKKVLHEDDEADTSPR